MKRIAYIGRSILLFIRFIFHWKKPAFNELYISDWVVEHNPLLVLKWKSKYQYRIKVKGTKFSICNKEGFHIVKLPTDAIEVIVLLNSGWRSSRFIVELKKMPVPAEVVKTFPIDVLSVQLPVVEKFCGYINWQETIHLVPPHVRMKPISTRRFQILIDTFRYSSD